jgi:hypothetical protein
MPRITKATADEVTTYAQQVPRPCYPLYGWVKFNGSRLPIERCGSWHPEDPKYEVMMPVGYVAMHEWTHTLLCHNLADVRERVDCLAIEQCDCEDCAPIWANN